MAAKQKKLLIVESPTKAKTITKILGHEFEVTSSMGHLRDLPASKLGVDVEHDFAPHYIVIMKRRKYAKELAEQARGYQEIYLAPDPDREGEAISWHLEALLRDDVAAYTRKEAEKAAKKAEKQAARDAAAAADGKAPAKQPAVKAKKGTAAPANSNGVDTRKIYRVTFHEITPQAVKAAIQHPTEINLNKVNAQQARRILDRLVGYSLSPLLWRKIGRGLSAGRVQSVALRLVVDREVEIEAFTPQEYWTIETELRQGDGPLFKARLDKVGGKKAEIGNQAEAERLAGELKGQAFSVAEVEQKEQKRQPKPPLTTSSLQQEAFNKLGFSSANSMRIAQQLYEGLEIGEDSPAGLITYMRTDSVRIADEAMKGLRSFIPKQFGQDYLPEVLRVYKSRKSAQEAHEAIRPTNVARTPESVRQYLDDHQFALYQLIWQRFVASQMAEAVDQVIGVRIDAGKFQLRASGRVNLFPGWTKAYQEAEEKPEEDALPEGALPPLAKGDALQLAGAGCAPSQHFTKPPRRFTDASLVKALEEAGIGRPSTYAPTIMTIVSRDYVRRQGGSFVPTQLGRIVTQMLIEHFPEVMDLQFTAEMEEELDRVEDGDLEWVSAVRHFYTPFSARVSVAQEKMREVKREVQETEHTCETCGKMMVIKWGRFGQFLSCSGWPECKTARPVPTGVKCTQCGGEMIERRGRGRVFYGCSKYPECRYTMRRLPKDGEAAPEPGAADAADESQDARE